jgi:hypothetical protein
MIRYVTLPITTLIGKVTRGENAYMSRGVDTDGTLLDGYRGDGESDRENNIGGRRSLAPLETTKAAEFRSLTN